MRLIYLLLLFAFSKQVPADMFTCDDKQGNKIFTDKKSNCSHTQKVTTSSYDSSNKSFYNEIPDLLQTKKSANFPGGGVQYCGPVAASNSLAWLSDMDDEDDQIDLVHKLGKREYMNTQQKNGTGTTAFIHGVEKYVFETWGRYKELKYSGWRKCPENYRAETDKPTISFMRTGLNRKAAVWLNIGWYKIDKLKNEYHRTGGHWVTLVGYERGRLIIHDPAPRAGKEFSNEFVSYSTLRIGKLVDKWNVTINAKGFFILDDGMHIPNKSDTAIIDGVVVLQI